MTSIISTQNSPLKTLHHCQDRWPLYINIHIKYTFRGAGRNEHAKFGPPKTESIDPRLTLRNNTDLVEFPPKDT